MASSQSEYAWSEERTVAVVRCNPLWVHAPKVPSVVWVGRCGEEEVEALDLAVLVHVPRIAAWGILFRRIGGIFWGRIRRNSARGVRPVRTCIDAVTIVIEGRRPRKLLDEPMCDQFTEVDEVVAAVDNQALIRIVISRGSTLRLGTGWIVAWILAPCWIVIDEPMVFGAIIFAAGRRVRPGR